MAETKKAKDASITPDIIRKVHLTLSDIKTGDSVINFLRDTEPVFIDEVNRFIKIELSRMRYQLTEAQALYIASVIGASYIAGFLIAREATHEMFDGLVAFKSDIKQALSQSEIDKIMDQKRSEGKSYKQIAKIIQNMLEKGKDISVKKPKRVPKANMGKRLDLGSLE